MESSAIATQSDEYKPIINNEGEYVDKVPAQHVFSVSGMRCPCSIRKDTVFWTRQSFVAHTKTKTHRNWLSELSLESTNMYIKVQEMEKTIKEQKILIARLERDVMNRDITIMTLTQQFSTIHQQTQQHQQHHQQQQHQQHQHHQHQPPTDTTQTATTCLL